MKKTYTLKCLSVVAAIAIAILGSGCVPNLLANSGLPDVVVVAQTPAASQVTAPGSDAHFIRVDDYLVMEQALGSQAFVYAGLGKMLVAPSPTTNNQGKFHRDLDNSDLWTRYFTKTRLAKRAELTLDKEVFFPSYQDGNGNYRAPETSTEARSGWWYKARITDVADIGNGFVTVGGGMRVNLNALRIAVN